MLPVIEHTIAFDQPLLLDIRPSPKRSWLGRRGRLGRSVALSEQRSSLREPEATIHNRFPALLGRGNPQTRRVAQQSPCSVFRGPPPTCQRREAQELVQIENWTAHARRRRLALAFSRRGPLCSFQGSTFQLPNRNSSRVLRRGQARPTTRVGRQAAKIADVAARASPRIFAA